MNREERLKQEIKEYFKIAIKVELEDSPQILDDYLYLEFEDKIGNEVKFRMDYPLDKKHFMDMQKGDRMLFILTNFMRFYFSE